MKKVTSNTFAKGLITDLNPLTTPPDTLVEARNIDFITTEGNQVILQKRVGNDPELWIDGEDQTIVTLTPGYKPLAVKELNNIAYIISYIDDGNDIIGEIGSFPSPEYDKFEFVVLGPLTPTSVDKESSFSDGTEFIPTFTMDPETVDNTYVLQNGVFSQSYTLTSTSAINDTIALSVDNEIIQLSTTLVTLPAGETVTFAVTVDTDEMTFEPYATVTAISLSDTSIVRESKWTNITVYITDPADWHSRNDAYTVSIATGGNVKKSDTNPVTQDVPPILDIYFGMPPTYPWHTLTVKWTFRDGSGRTGLVSKMSVVDASGAVTGEGTSALVVTGSTYLRISLDSLGDDLLAAIPHDDEDEEITFKINIREDVGGAAKGTIIFKGDTYYDKAFTYSGYVGLSWAGVPYAYGNFKWWARID